MNNICSDVVLDGQAQARAGKCIIHCFYGNHLIEMQIPVFGVKKKRLSLFMMAEWEVLGEAFCAFQTPKHSRLHDIDSPYYWVPYSMQ